MSCGVAGSSAAARCRKRLYLRRSGAHCWWASPIIRISSRASGETCGPGVESEVESEVEREVRLGAWRAVEGGFEGIVDADTGGDPGEGAVELGGCQYWLCCGA